MKLAASASVGNDMLVKQYDFEHVRGDAAVVHQTAWVDASWRLRVGTVVSFKNDPRHWKVVRVGNDPMNIEDINQTWEVGGL